MRLEDTVFPVYRRYANGRNFFKIMNPLLFEEVQLLGSRTVVKITEAKLYPEKNFVRDLVEGRIGEIITAEAYERVKGG
jgi:hypothetical protein